MHQSPYLLLIEDTLHYLKGLLPKNEEVEPPIFSEKPTTKVSPSKLPLSSLKEAPKPPPPIQTPPPSQTTSDVFLKLEPLPSRLPLSLEMARQYLQKIDPALPFCQTIPNDSEAKQIKEGWKTRALTPAISILFQDKRSRTFITHLAKAIDTVYGSCRTIDISFPPDWDLFLHSKHLKLIIAPEKVIFETPPLLAFYREIPQKQVRTLGPTPLFLLSDFTLYIQKPTLKRSLWNALCHTLDSLQSS